MTNSMTDSTAGAPGDYQPKKTLSDEEILAYTTADPFAMTSTKPWELTITSPFLRKVSWLCIAIFIPVHVFMGVLLDVVFTGAYIIMIYKFVFHELGTTTCSV